MNTITVVIPTYNRRPRLQVAIESVLRETRIPLTVHVFDNASTDDTESWVRGLAARDPRVTYSRNADNVGAERNYVHALDSIDSAYFVPLADDDWLLPDFLFDAFGILEADPDLGAAIYMTEARDEAGHVHNTYPVERGKIRFGRLDPAEHLRDWMTHGHYGWSSILWRKTALDFVGYPYLHTGLSSDVDFQLQVFSRFPVHIVDRSAAVYALHPDQASRAHDVTRIPGWAKFARRMDDALAGGVLFDSTEYGRLRSLVVDRFKGGWNVPPATPPTDRRSIQLAAMAAIRLDDWPLAFSLLDRVDANGAAKEHGLLHAFLRVARRDGSTIARLTAEADARDTRIDTLNTELNETRARLEHATAKLSAASRKPIVRMLQRLGLARFE